jgi:hypothetical protein
VYRVQSLYLSHINRFTSRRKERMERLRHNVAGLKIETRWEGVRHVTGTGSGLLGGIPRVVVQMSALTLKGPL